MSDASMFRSQEEEDEFFRDPPEEKYPEEASSDVDEDAFDEDEPDDVCDLCFTSQVHCDRTTYCGKTIGIECGCEEEYDDGCCDNEACEACDAGYIENNPEDED